MHSRSTIKENQPLCALPPNTTQVTNTTQLERETQSIISPTRRWLLLFQRTMSFPLYKYLYDTDGCVNDPPGEKVAQYVCPTHPRWSTADLSTVLNLNGMTELERNFSALCLNQTVKTLILGWARSSATPCRLSRGPALLNYDLEIPNPGLSNLSKHCPTTCRCIRKMSLPATVCSV